METEENKPEFVKSELAKYDEGYVPEYRNRNMAVEVVDTGKDPVEDQNGNETDGEKVVAQAQEAQPVSQVEKKEDNSKCGPGKIVISMTGKALKEVLAVIKTADEEALFKFTKDGISVKVIDPAHVAMVSVNIPRDSLSEYWYKTEADEIRAAIDVDRLAKLMPYGAKDAIQLTIETKNDKSEKGLTVSNGSITATVSLLDENSVLDPRIPTLNMTQYAVLPAIKFRDVLRTAVLITDAVRIEYNTETVRIRAITEEESVDTVFTRDDMKELKVMEPGKSAYPLDYLVNIMKTVKADEIRISLKDDYPMRIESYLMPSTGGEKNINVDFLLAPRMEE